MDGAVLDRETLDRLRELTPPGEPDVLTEVLQLFLQDAPRRLETLRGALATGDAVGVQRAAHSLKGSAGNIGALGLLEACRVLDDAARAGGLAGAEPLAAAVAREFARVEAEIRGLLSPPGASAKIKT